MNLPNFLIESREMRILPEAFISRGNSVLRLSEVPRKLRKKKNKPADEYITHRYPKSPGGSRIVPG